MDGNEAKLVRLCAWSCVVFMVIFGVGRGVLGRKYPAVRGEYASGAAGVDLSGSGVHAAHRLRARCFRGHVPGFLGDWVVPDHVAPGARRSAAVLSSACRRVLSSLVPMFACIVWLTSAFRPEQDPAIIRILFDVDWLTVDLAFGVTILQYVALGVVALRDPRDKPLFPRWLAWLGIWIALEFVVELITP
jgi:uncharacterized membrane protein